MQTDFFDAHQRHWNDAEYLHQAQRWANADHLYGMSVECGLKRLMMAFGMSIDAQGSPSDKKDRQHADGIWTRFESYRHRHTEGVGYALSANPFADWEASQRYAAQSSFDQSRIERHQAGAQAVYALLKKAQKDGLI